MLIDNPPCLEVVTKLYEDKNDTISVCSGTLTHESPTLFLKYPNYTLEEKFSYVEKYLCDFQLSLVPTRRPRYHQKLGDAWIPKVLVTIRKQTQHAILDLGSSVFVLSKVLVDDSNGYMVEFTSNACNYYERGGDKIPHYATNNYKLQGAAVNIHWKTSIHCYSFIYKMPMHRKEVRLCCYYFAFCFSLYQVLTSQLL
jgi:hypothetical protein